MKKEKSFKNNNEHFIIFCNISIILKKNGWREIKKTILFEWRIVS